MSSHEEIYNSASSPDGHSTPTPFSSIYTVPFPPSDFPAFPNVDMIPPGFTVQYPNYAPPPRYKGPLLFLTPPTDTKTGYSPK